MPVEHLPRFLLWARWAVFSAVLAVVLFLQVDAVIRATVPTPEKPELTALELRHVRLTEQVVKDLQPDFSHSFSEPLKRMVPHRTDGLVQPLWPWMAAWMHEEADLKASLHRGTLFRLGLTLGLLALLGITCARNFTLPAALLVVLITGMHGFLPTLTSHTGATLHHMFFLLAWIACVYALQRNSLWIYGLIGGLGALAYLAEDRALPLVLVFVFVSTVRAFWGWLASHWARHQGISLWVRRNHVFGMILLVSTLGFIAGPRWVEAGATLGQGWFSYIDQVRWLDTPTEAEDWVRRHPDARRLNSLPLEERLNAQIYLDSHSRDEVLGRLALGLDELWQRYAQDGGWQITLLMAILIALCLAAWWGTPRASHAGQKLHPETATTVLFILGACVLFLTIAAWDSAVWETDHVRALLAPLALSLIWACESILRRARRRAEAHWIKRAYLSLLWAMIAVDLLLHLQGR